MNARPPAPPTDSSRPVARIWPALCLTLALALLLAAPPGRGAVTGADGDAPSHLLADGGPSHQALPSDPGQGGCRRERRDDDPVPPPTPPALPVAAPGPLLPAVSPPPVVTFTAPLPGPRCRTPGAPRAPPL